MLWMQALRPGPEMSKKQHVWNISCAINLLRRGYWPSNKTETHMYAYKNICYSPKLQHKFQSIWGWDGIQTLCSCLPSACPLYFVACVMSEFCITLCALLFFFPRHCCKLLFRKVKTTPCFSWKSCMPCSASVFIDIAVTMIKPNWSRYGISCAAIPFWITKPIISVVLLLLPHRGCQEAGWGH